MRIEWMSERKMRKCGSINFFFSKMLFSYVFFEKWLNVIDGAIWWRRRKEFYCLPPMFCYFFVRWANFTWSSGSIKVKISCCFALQIECNLISFYAVRSPKYVACFKNDPSWAYRFSLFFGSHVEKITGFRLWTWPMWIQKKFPSNFGQTPWLTTELILFGFVMTHLQMRK